MKVLFAASEAFSLVKTGGLGDVIYALPRALKRKGVDVRLILPAYREVLDKLDSFKIIGWQQVPGSNRKVYTRLLDAGDTHLGLPLLLVDAPGLLDRPGGGPYQQHNGFDWPDNAERFTVFSRAVAEYARGNMENHAWNPDVVHSHDWQTGLVSAFLSKDLQPPKTVFTIHNLAYGGHFGHDDFVKLYLPGEWWAADGVEFYNNFSMLKAGIVFSNKVTTVSPTYAREILTPEFACGYHGLLESYAAKLTGILNGIDSEVWNPGTDKLIAQNYKVDKNLVTNKQVNKKALLSEFCLGADKVTLSQPLLGFVGRLVDQKGIDLILAAIPQIISNTSANFVIIGSGSDKYQMALVNLQKKYPRRIGVYLGYSEAKGHLLEAGSDIFLMPSRFEPCGLNQLYSLAYGTPPIVNFTGGLADTVVDATSQTLANNTATGFVFHQAKLEDFVARIEDAVNLYASKKTWLQLMRNCMRQDFSWDHSAASYLEIYDLE